MPSFLLRFGIMHTFLEVRMRSLHAFFVWVMEEEECPLDAPCRMLRLLPWRYIREAKG